MMVEIASPRGGESDGTDHSAPDGRKSWIRLVLALTIVTVGGLGMWCLVVILPAVQAEFGISRSQASLPYTALMLGVAVGSVVLGRLSDRLGIVSVTFGGGALLAFGFITAGFAPNLAVFTLIHGACIGIGCSASFGPVVSDISLWFQRRRGIAVAVAASGNYVAGAIWPPLVQSITAWLGWRTALMGFGVLFCVTLLPLALLLGKFGSPPADHATNRVHEGRKARSVTGLSGNAVQGLLVLAGLGCCVAMSMPQVHIVAYCGDLGYGPARGSEMLALMLGFGIISRIGSGFIGDRIGGIPTLLAGSMLQCLALVFYSLFDSLLSLYIISALFGLFQGGIVPSYAIITRELFPAREAGQRFGICLAATLVGMALGGWLSGKIFDLSGSYELAFLNGIAWNLLNLTVALFLMLRSSRRSGPSTQAVLT
jgi:MFS family permease